MKSICLAAALSLCLGCNNASTPSSSSPPSETGPAAHHGKVPANPENTGVNVRDRDSTAKTPIDQNENQSDIDITANIRKQVTGTKMSSNAHNVKIITQDGKVTLRGPVGSEDEKNQIEQIAVKVAGADHVENLLDVSTEK